LQNFTGPKKTFVQIVVSYTQGDGIGNIITSFHEKAQKEGHPSFIFSLAGNKDTTLAPEELKSKAQGLAQKDTVLIYHYGSPHPILDALFKNLPEDRRVFYYHNVTPEKFFWPWEPPIARIVANHEDHLKTLLAGKWKVTADSYFNFEHIPNHESLQRLKPTIPAKIEQERNRFPDVIQKKTDHSQGSDIHITFVGRFAPNKRQEILIYLAYRLRQAGLPTRLSLVGKGMGLYKIYIKLVIKLFKMRPYVDIIEKANDDDLEVIFSKSNYCAISSEHEGFCLPLFESLYRGLIPIVRPFGSLKEYLNGTEFCSPSESLESFVRTSERIIRDTWNKENAYALALNTAVAHTDKKFKAYQTTYDLIHSLNSQTIPGDTKQESQIQPSPHSISSANTAKHQDSWIQTRILYLPQSLEKLSSYFFWRQVYSLISIVFRVTRKAAILIKG